jgi:hypothetical protein
MWRAQIKTARRSPSLATPAPVMGGAATTPTRASRLTSLQHRKSGYWIVAVRPLLAG